MSPFLVIVPALLVAGILLTLALAHYQPRYSVPASAAIAAASLLIWLPAAAGLPLTSQPGQGGAVAQLWANTSLVVDQNGWQLSLGLLLLLTAVLLFWAARLEAERSNEDVALASRVMPPALLLALAALLSIWAASLAYLITGWTLLVVAWAWLLFAAGVTGERLSALARRLAALLMGLLFLGLAAATLSTTGATITGASGWPVWPRSFLILAAASQLGAFPLQWWRPADWPLPRAVLALAHLLPSAAGAALLAHLALPGGGTIGYSLFLTAFGLLGMLLAASAAWSNLAQPAQLAAALSAALASLILLLGAWAGPESVVGGSRVLLLAAGAFFLVEFGPTPWPMVHRAGLLLAVAAIAGLPLTAGFTPLVDLYNGWLDGGRFLLVGVTALILALLIGAALLRVWNRPAAEATDAATRLPWPAAVTVAAHGLLVLGLFGLPGLPLGEVKLVSWLAIGLAAAAGLALTRFGRQVHEVQEIVSRALRPQLALPETRLGPILARWLDAVRTALRQATDTLEGETGMLWLLVFIAAIWLAQLIS